VANLQPTLRTEPNLSELKVLARKLRVALEAYGVKVSHPVSLDLIAEVHNYKDWKEAEKRIGELTN
jgi:hypothetical protein